jgi:hypothetical protein
MKSSVYIVVAAAALATAVGAQGQQFCLPCGPLSLTVMNPPPPPACPPPPECLPPWHARIHPRARRAMLGWSRRSPGTELGGASGGHAPPPSYAENFAERPLKYIRIDPSILNICLSAPLQAKFYSIAPIQTIFLAPSLNMIVLHTKVPNHPLYWNFHGYNPISVAKATKPNMGG